jgi:hypothetical protein
VSPAAQLLALLALAFPASAPLLRLDVADAIVRAANTHHVPVAIVAAVAWAESRAGTAPRYASLAGVRVAHRYIRSDALSADIAARSLARRHAECGSWPGALASYRWGRGCSTDPTRYAPRVLDVARRLGWQSSRATSLRRGP